MGTGKTKIENILKHSQWRAKTKYRNSDHTMSETSSKLLNIPKILNNLGKLGMGYLLE